jgi:hypothetical protein
MDLQRLFLIHTINKALTDPLDEVDLYVLRHVVRGVDSVWGEPCNAQRREGACSTLVCPVEQNKRSVKLGEIDNVVRTGRTCAAIIALEGALERKHIALADWIRHDYNRHGKDIILDAARFGKIKLIQYFHERGLVAPTAPKKHQRTPVDRIMGAAAESGSTELLEYLRLKGYRCPASAAVTAAWFGHKEVIGWMIVNGIDISPSTTSLYAAKSGHLRVLILLHERKMLDDQAFDGAAEMGYHEIIGWLLSVGKFPKDRSLYFAARGGQKRVVMRLLEIGAHWPANVTEAAAEHSLDMLEWVLDQGAPWSPRACIKALMKGHFNVTEVADRRGLAYDYAQCRALKNTLSRG